MLKRVVVDAFQSNGVVAAISLGCTETRLHHRLIVVVWLVLEGSNGGARLRDVACKGSVIIRARVRPVLQGGGVAEHRVKSLMHSTVNIDVTPSIEIVRY